MQNGFIPQSRFSFFVCVLAWLLIAGPAWPQPSPAGEVKGSAVQHTPESALAVIQGAALVLPARATGNVIFAGALRNAPQKIVARVPVVVFMHGSSGLGLKAIGEWQTWLATQGIASLAPDSFALPDRVTYQSPVRKEVYEKLLALRASEIKLAVQAMPSLAWADTRRMVLAGTSEGATAVARYAGPEFIGRIIFSWSCESNYFVDAPRTDIPIDQPVLNIMGASDPYFSKSNPWLGNPDALGHCGAALKDHKHASIVLIPGAPHTLMNLPQARQAAEGFLYDLLQP